jgi:hypothetical protein
MATGPAVLPVVILVLTFLVFLAEVALRRDVFVVDLVTVVLASAI